MATAARGARGGGWRAAVAVVRSAQVLGDFLGGVGAVGGLEAGGEGVRGELVLLGADGLQDGGRDQAAELGGPLQGELPGYGGQEAGAEGVAAAGRVDSVHAGDRRYGDRGLAGLADPGTVGAKRGDLDLDPGEDLLRGPAGLLLDQGQLVLVGEQVGRAVDQLAGLPGVHPGQLLRRVRRERDTRGGGPGRVPEHRLGVVGADQHQVDPAGPGGDVSDGDVPRLGHRPGIERGDLVAVLVGGADEPGGVVPLGLEHAAGVDAVRLQPGAVLGEVLPNGTDQQGLQAKAAHTERDVRGDAALPDLQAVHEERQGDPVELVRDQMLGEFTWKGHQVVGGHRPRDRDTHRSVERVAAGAGARRVRVVDREALLLDRVHEVDGGTHEVRRAHLVRHDPDAAELLDDVAVEVALVKVELVAQARAATRLDRHAQPQVVAALLVEQVADLRGRTLGEKDALSGLLLNGHRYVAPASVKYRVLVVLSSHAQR